MQQALPGKGEWVNRYAGYFNGCNLPGIAVGCHDHRSFYNIPYTQYSRFDGGGKHRYGGGYCCAGDYNGHEPPCGNPAGFNWRHDCDWLPIVHTQLKIPALLSGILTMIALWSINLRIMGKANISLLRMNTVYTQLETLGLDKVYAVIIIGLIVVFALITCLYWFFGTEIGSAIRATGSNPHMVRAQGINTNTTIILGLIISNGLVLSGA